jgi:cytochrome c556
MAAFCPSTNEAFDDTALMRKYSGVSILPSQEVDDSNRNSDEFQGLTANFLVNHVSSLKGTVIPAPPEVKYAKQTQDELIRVYMQKVEELKTIIRNEYCYYEARYKYAIRTLFTNISNATAGATGATQANIDKYTNFSVILNRRLQDISQVANAITEDQYLTTQQFQTEINVYNTEINQYFDTLKKHAAILKKEVPAVELKKRMVEYTREKANAHKNLLSLYFFLDVVALGLLFYVYKAT